MSVMKCARFIVFIMPPKNSGNIMQIILDQNPPFVIYY